LRPLCATCWIFRAAVLPVAVLVQVGLEVYGFAGCTARLKREVTVARGLSERLLPVWHWQCQ
jgi:hypothetical protein